MEDYNDYDVVTAILKEHRDKLMDMTNTNMRMGRLNVMDDIRMDQVDEIERAMKLWKERETKESRTYNEMNDWLFETESFGQRIDRMYEDLGLKDCHDIAEYARLLRWLEAAFNAGRDGK